MTADPPRPAPRHARPPLPVAAASRRASSREPGPFLPLRQRLLRWVPVLWWITCRTVGELPSRPLGVHYIWAAVAGTAVLILAVEGWLGARRKVARSALPAEA